MNISIFSGPEYTTSPYVSGQGNQVANQGPGSLRAIQQQPVPPSSTPPNADLKVQQLPPQSSINPNQLVSVTFSSLNLNKQISLFFVLVYYYNSY